MLSKLLRATLIVALTTLTPIIATQNLSADTLHHSDGYRTSTTATGGLDNERVHYRAWADYFAKLYRGASIDKVKGKYNLIAFVAGGRNPSDQKRSYTMKRKFLGIPIGDEVMKHHYDTTTWTGTNPYAYARASGKCGSLTNKTEKWFSTQDD